CIVTLSLSLYIPRLRQHLIPTHPPHHLTSFPTRRSSHLSIFPGPSPPTTSASPAIGWNAARGLPARTSRKSPHPPHRLSTTLAWMAPLHISTPCAPLTRTVFSALIILRSLLRRWQLMLPH